MPAAVLVVHDEENTRELAVNALRAAFLDAVGFEDPLKALVRSKPVLASVSWLRV